MLRIGPSALALIAGLGVAGGVAAAETRVLLLASRAAAAEQQPMTQAVLAHVSDLEVSISVVWVDVFPAALEEQIAAAEEAAAREGAALVIWHDARRADRLFMVVPDDPETPFLARRLGGAGEGGVAESVALICRGAIRAFRQGLPLAAVEDEAQVPVTKETAAAAPAPPPQPGVPTPPIAPVATAGTAPAGGKRRLSVEGGYTYSAWSRENPAVQGGHLAVGVRVAPIASVHLGYHFLSTIQGAVADLRLELHRHPIAAGIRLVAPFGRVELGGEVAVLVDPVTESVAVSGAMQASGERSEVLVSALLTARLQLTIFDWLRFYAAAGVELPFVNMEYVVETEAGRQTVADPWKARPVGLAGLSAAFL